MSCSVYDCVLRPKIVSARSLINLKMSKKNHTRNISMKI